MKKLLIVLAVASLAGCATSDPDVVYRGETQRMSVVQDATVLSVRPVTIEGGQSGAGTVTGAVIGGVAGSSVGGHRESIAIGVLGAVVGGIIGNAVERNATREEAVEIMVQLRNGERRSIVQGRGGEQLGVGDPVILVTTGGRTRVSRAPSAAPSYQPVPSSGSGYNTPTPVPLVSPVPAS